MICKNCGAQCGSYFCTKCGYIEHENVPVCPVCKTRRKLSARYCSKCGFEFKTIGTASISVGKKNIITAIVATILAIVVICAIVIPVVVVSNNIFRVGKIDKINIGDSKEEVIKVLGKPYRDNGGLLQYYDKKYTNLLKRYESDDFLDGDLGDIEDTFDEMAELYNAIQTTEHKYIEVILDSNDKVRSIYFDAKRTEETKYEPKEYMSHELVTTSVVMFEPTDIVYSVTLQDGSFYKGIAIENFIADEYNTVIEWKDGWKDDYRATISVLKNTEFDKAEKATF